MKKNLIKTVFDFDKDKNDFKDKSKRFQHISRYFLFEDTEWHKITKIQDRVLGEIPDLFDIDKSKPKSANKKKENKRFKLILSDLVNLKIIISREAKNEKDGGTTDEYKVTSFGKIVVCMTDYILSDNKKISVDKLYDHLKSMLSDKPASIDLFLISYLEKCKNLGLFSIFVEFFINSFIEGKDNIRNINYFFTQMALVRTNSPNQNKILLTLWMDSYLELGEINIKYLSNHIRLHINRIIERQAEEIDKYELKRYQSNHLIDCIIAEFQCEFCNFSQYENITIRPYIIYCFNGGHKEMDKLFTQVIKCNNCQENDLKLNPIF